MPKYIFTRDNGPWDYPTLGFRATLNDVIEATAAPDAWWEETDPGATVTIPVTPSGGIEEPPDGSVLVYRRSTNEQQFELLTADIVNGIQNTPAGRAALAAAVELTGAFAAKAIEDAVVSGRLSEASLADAFANKATETTVASGRLSEAALSATIDDRVTTAATRAFMHKLITGRPVIATALGDSTTIYTTSWYDGLMTWLAAQYPSFTYARREWDTDAEVYKPVAIVQAGPSGRRRLVATNTTTDHFFTIADSAQVSPTGDHRVEVKLKMPSVLPAAGIPLAGKWNSAGNQRGWFLQHNGASGTLSFWYSTDGVNQTQVNSTVALPTTLNGVDVWLRADLDVDNGAAGKDIKFWYSTDDRATWTQLGATVTSAGVITVFDNTLPLQFVGRSAAVVAMPSWEFYEFRLYDNIAGTGAPRAHIDLLAWDWYGPFSDLAGNIVTVSGTTGRVGSPTLYSFNGGAPGQTIGYAIDPGRFPKYAAPTASDLVFINFSHNESTVDTFRADVASLVGSITARWADTGFVIAAQNPRTAPLSAANIAKHAERVARIINYAIAQRHGVIDAFRALGENTALYVATDGIHPTQAGYDRWRDEAKKILVPWQVQP